MVKRRTVKYFLRRILALFVLCVPIYYLYTTVQRPPGYTKLKGSTRRKALIKKTFIESWTDYETYGWGKDEYYPIIKRGRNYLRKGMGWMIIDSLDTMMIMGLDEQVLRAREWVNNSLTWNQDDEEVSVFETTIRILGGLLSSYHLSQDKLYLDRAVDLADRLLAAYNTSTGLPRSNVNLGTRKSRKRTREYFVSTAESGTVQMELRYLSYLTGDPKYWITADKTMEVLLGDATWSHTGLVPITVNLITGAYVGRNIRLGSHGDSYYEYLLKQDLQLFSSGTVYRKAFDLSVDGIIEYLLNYTTPNHFAYIAELPGGLEHAQLPKMDHLVCFLPGTLMWGATNGTSLEAARTSKNWGTRQERDVKLAQELMRTCYEMYNMTATGLAPEIVFFDVDQTKNEIYSKRRDQHNLMRPETVESLFILYRITRDEIYREWGWNIFVSFLRYSRLPGRDAFTCLDSVESKKVKDQRDKTESFWFAETLKYLYLLFEDDFSILPLTNYTFNTEAHPFPNIENNMDLYTV
ncbi:Endoplasmic reticulum mannosyl-oligosaccharide 1,2-alpha-mannosidase [Schizosaccharomyces pombe]|uniref:Endoplasmic reticulum mannosyl-oligosaccharide 1,2-alpha-mannosidase n=1 Tax=Schizosaccharomyces pombe (strain 972 / ATCC 24843) TaxID=284812 RepID=MNS1_SCHPO|nr:mannosyl-oligosaccharide 1,2-alpha-mannosidase [Schizosaccharomyces pombe]Q9P7C3.2 RecName: Full=Endoplasmic reticulum mannosyl-oligosaccharide 1,2-alpha-mannosidase; AltName: Full=ER alpha-1,2-mannosidase; AltName: Full=Man(9)-alpha-mannosidase [Schizosaccharomyces pombe 972h-]CAC36930.2 mannosyl-oligosaccharide 1,2-alpha-mannosidase [Schizosaccharomyces pombe]|eukprot:NP_594139.2 mannosyl-oligosaccharide 1,2-alpha-mannosidase [Schizosaccharomyces pombe]